MWTILSFKIKKFSVLKIYQTIYREVNKSNINSQGGKV